MRVGLARDDARGPRRAPGRTMRANGSAASSRVTTLEAVAVDDGQPRRAPPGRRHVVAHRERAQLRRRRAERELEVAVDAAPAVGGEHQAVDSA